MNEGAMRDIRIPALLYHQAEQVLTDYGYSSVDDLVIAIVSEFLTPDNSIEKPDSADDQVMKKRLEELGYFLS